MSYSAYAPPQDPASRRISSSNASSANSYTSSSLLLQPPPPPYHPHPPRSSSASSYYPKQDPNSTSASMTMMMSTSSLSPPMTSSPSYVRALTGSLTIEEMRELHRRAMQEADAKRTELRLVLASRYRELVGSSDQVLQMRDRSKELHSLVEAIPGLAGRLFAPMTTTHPDGNAQGEDNKPELLAGSGSSTSSSSSLLLRLCRLRSDLCLLPRLLHRSLETNDVFRASLLLLRLMAVIDDASDISRSHPSQSHESSSSHRPSFSGYYPLASKLGSRARSVWAQLGLADIAADAAKIVQGELEDGDDHHDEQRQLLRGQVRMVYFMVETTAQKIAGLSVTNLEGERPGGPAGDGASDEENKNDDEEDDHLRSGFQQASTLRYGAELVASSLSANHLLQVSTPEGVDEAEAASGAGTRLINWYFACKAKRLMRLLEKLSLSASSSTSSPSGSPATASAATASSKEGSGKVSAAVLDGTAGEETSSPEAILSDLVLLIQYDCILYPYLVFCRRQFPYRNNPDRLIESCLPPFDPGVARARCSAFLAHHLPLIRTRAGAVLTAAGGGTTAGALGRIRQKLYDRTDGAESLQALREASGAICSWDEAVGAMVDLTVVGDSTTTTAAAVSKGSSSPLPGEAITRSFSLWSALFSGTFSSLVHSILSSSFSSVHTSLLGSLRSSLLNAPDWSLMLPHEAHRNALKIASGLNDSLVRLREDAHELLVHAEERLESEQRLRQSLYVQTCEILGRLLCELRCLVSGGGADATRDWIVGRLCFLLKFRLSCLPALLDPSASPASSFGAGGGSSAMTMGSLSSSTSARTTFISAEDLRSAFDLADHDEDGLVSFDEALELMDAAFSGTGLRGAELVRETLLVGPNRKEGDDKQTLRTPASPPVTSVALSELTLLGARGLRHDADSGPGSALGVFQKSLDDLVSQCFERWSHVALEASSARLEASLRDFASEVSSTADDAAEWLRIHGISSAGGSTTESQLSSLNVSPHVLCHFLDASSLVNRITCPSDFLCPVPSAEYARSLAIPLSGGDGSGSDFNGPSGASNTAFIPTLADRLRRTLVLEALGTASCLIGKHVNPDSFGDGAAALWSLPALWQLYLDVTFIASLVNGDGSGLAAAPKKELEGIKVRAEKALLASRGPDPRYASASLLERQRSTASEACALFLGSLFGSTAAGVAAAALPMSSASAVEVSAAGTARGVQSSSITATAGLLLLRAPLASTKRFPLLPVQHSDRTLNDLQMRNSRLGGGRHGRQDGFSASGGASSSSVAVGGGGGVVSSGLGFLSSMLKKS